MRLGGMVLLSGLAWTAAACGWGSGHDDVSREIVRGLREDLGWDLAAPQSKALEQYGHYADSFEPFEPELIGQRAMEVLAAHGMKVRYDLHHDPGRAVAFGLLVEALRERHRDRAIFWIGNLGHTTADMVACNHDPLIHVATYAWGPYGLDLGGGVPAGRLAGLLDLAGSARDQAGGASMFRRLVDEMKLDDDGCDAATAMVRVMTAGHEGAAFCSARGATIVRDAAVWLRYQDPVARERLWRAMGELGAWSVVRVLRYAEVAERLAQSGETVELNADVMTAYRAKVEALTRGAELGHEALYQPILRDFPAEGAVVGVVLEPTWRMNEAMLGFVDRVIATSICRTLDRCDRPYATLDIRRLLTEPWPSADRMPIVVLSATSLGDYIWMRKADLERGLKAYRAAGGAVLWIGGGKPLPTALGEPSRGLAKGPDPHYPLPLGGFLGASLSLTTSGASWAVKRTPETPAGWQRPRCPYYFSDHETAGVDPLLTIRAEDRELVVGATWPRGRPRVAYLPVYALSAYLFGDSDLLLAPSEPRLDEVGETVLLAALDRLAQ